MTSRRLFSFAAACAIAAMALAVPAMPAQAEPHLASPIVAVASSEAQTDAVSVSAAPASSQNVLAPSRRFHYHGGGSSSPVFGAISVVIFIGVCVALFYDRRRRERIAREQLRQNSFANTGSVGPQYGVSAPSYNAVAASGPQAMPYQPNGAGSTTGPHADYGYASAPGQQGYYPPQQGGQGGQGYGQYPPTYR